MIESITEDNTEHRLVFTGTAGGLYPIFLINLLLTGVTLGFYRFWAKIRTRSYIWSHTSLFGSRFEYTGTGRELLVGFFIILLVVGFPISLFELAMIFLNQMGNHNFARGLSTGEAVFIYYLIGVGTFSTLRYRLTRTRWHGIRGGMTGSAPAYGLRFLKLAGRPILTLGLKVPHARIQAVFELYEHAYFGNEKFKFAADAAPLMKSWIAFYIPAVAFVLSVIIGLAVSPVLFVASGLLAIAMLVTYLRYRARFLSHVYSHLSLAGLTFRYQITGGQLLRLWLGNWAIFVITLGLGYPFIVIRQVRFITDNLVIRGRLDEAALRQNRQDAPSFGEGLADIFDIGAV